MVLGVASVFYSYFGRSGDPLIVSSSIFFYLRYRLVSTRSSWDSSTGVSE